MCGLIVCMIVYNFTASAILHPPSFELPAVDAEITEWLASHPKGDTRSADVPSEKETSITVQELFPFDPNTASAET